MVTPTDIAARCLETLKEAKIELTRRDGIGSDIRPALFGFKDNKFFGYAQLRSGNYVQSRDDDSQLLQLAKLSQAAMLMRQGWGCDALALGTENFVAIDALLTEDSFTEDSFTEDSFVGDSLEARFANGDVGVVETLTTLAVMGGEAAIISQPYTYQVGRTLLWDTPLLLEDAPLSHPNPRMLVAALGLPVFGDGVYAEQAALQLIADLGFIVRTLDGYGV